MKAAATSWTGMTEPTGAPAPPWVDARPLRAWSSWSKPGTWASATGSSVGTDRVVNQAWVVGPESRVVDLELGIEPGREVVHQDVSLADQSQERLVALRVADVEGDPALALVDGHEPTDTSR